MCVWHYSKRCKLPIIVSFWKWEDSGQPQESLEQFLSLDNRQDDIRSGLGRHVNRKTRSDRQDSGRLHLIAQEDLISICASAGRQSSV